jgi:hypothetical protein
MVKRSDKTNTGEGGKGKESRTVSDDSGGNSLSDTSTSAGAKSTVIRTSVNIFETSKRDKPPQGRHVGASRSFVRFRTHDPGI